MQEGRGPDFRVVPSWHCMADMLPLECPGLDSVAGEAFGSDSSKGRALLTLRVDNSRFLSLLVLLPHLHAIRWLVLKRTPGVLYDFPSCVADLGTNFLSGGGQGWDYRAIIKGRSLEKQLDKY